MKKYFLLFLFQTIASATELVYCPAALQCTTQSCEFTQHAQAYWSPVTRTGETILPGEYALSYVSAPYHKDDGGYAICVYTHNEVYQTRMLRATPGIHLVIFEDPQTTWRPEESWGECRPETMAACPLQRDET